MKKSDNQKMNMYAAVLQTCKAQQTVWENIPGFAAAVNELESQLAILHQIHVQQDTVTLGVRLSKEQLRTELIDHLYVIAKALALKGMNTGDRNLELRNKSSLSAWRMLSGNALLHKAEIVRQDLLIHGASLNEYGITAAFIDEAQTLNVAMQNMLFKPRLAIVAKKGLTQNVKEQRQRIDRLVKEQLDTLILVFKSSLPSFFIDYCNARIIIDPVRGSKTPPQPDDGAMA